MWNYAGKPDKYGAKTGFNPIPQGKIYPTKDANATYQYQTCSDAQCSKLKIIVLMARVGYTVPTTKSLRFILKKP